MLPVTPANAGRPPAPYPAGALTVIRTAARVTPRRRHTAAATISGITVLPARAPDHKLPAVAPARAIEAAVALAPIPVLPAVLTTAMEALTAEAARVTALRRHTAEIISRTTVRPARAPDPMRLAVAPGRALEGAVSLAPVPLLPAALPPAVAQIPALVPAVGATPMTSRRYTEAVTRRFRNLCLGTTWTMMH